MERKRSVADRDERRRELAVAMAAAALGPKPLALLADTTIEAVRHWLAGRRDVPGYALTILDLYRRLPQRERVRVLRAKKSAEIDNIVIDTVT